MSTWIYSVVKSVCPKKEGALNLPPSWLKRIKLGGSINALMFFFWNDQKVVEITKGSKVKYELDKKTGLIKVSTYPY